MINTFTIIGYCTGSAMLVLMLMSLVYAIVMPMSDRWSKKYFITFFSLLTVCVCSVFVSAFLYNIPELAQAEKVACYIESLLISVLMPMPTILLLHSCNEKLAESKLLRTVIILWAAYFIIIMFGLFTDYFFVVTPENKFKREPWFPMILIPLAIIMILNIAGVIRRRGKLSKRYFVAFLIYLLPMTAFIIIHTYIDIELILILGVGICALSMYSLIVAEHISRYIRQQREIADQQREIAHQRANVMVLQMRPHFIYNTMMSIYYLCKQDADKAQQVTLDFTTYLRKNFTAIAGDETVPFKNELEHTRAYLAVEQAQHEDMLYVDYDTPHINFKVPTLTLQPLVENAVKHSLDPNGDPLHIYVMTRKTNEGNVIIVENNGIDYKPGDDNEPHTALTNIRQRLKMMCSGELEIVPREGGGTIVKVTVPFSEQ